METTKTKKKLWMPNVYSLLLILCVVAAALTYIIPAGSFERTTTGNYTTVVPGSFAYIDQAPQNLWSVFTAIVAGFKAQSSLIYMIFFVGAAVYMLEQSRAINTIFGKLARAVKGKEWVAVLLVMGFMSIGGATGVFGNVTLVLIPIGIFLSEAMGFDKALGFFMIFFGGFSGFNVGWGNTGTIGIAQTIAELPMLSGMGARVIFHIVNFILCYSFVLLYLNSIKKDPKRSLNFEAGMQKTDYMGGDMKNEAEIGSETVTKNQIACMACLFGGIGMVIYGALNLKWGADKISACFLIVAILEGFCSCRDLNEVLNRFIKGCSTMVVAAFIVGFANGITQILSNGKVLDTIVYFLSSGINQFGAVFGANMMLLCNILVNFFISSGSGQATAVMPIMVPIADLTGITRQVAVQCYQFGDGFTNCIIPTVGTLMGGLGFAKLGYGKYLKKVWVLILTQLVLSFVAITVLQSIGWTGV